MPIERETKAEFEDRHGPAKVKARIRGVDGWLYMNGAFLHDTNYLDQIAYGEEPPEDRVELLKRKSLFFSIRVKQADREYQQFIRELNYRDPVESDVETLERHKTRLEAYHTLHRATELALSKAEGKYIPPEVRQQAELEGRQREAKKAGLKRTLGQMVADKRGLPPSSLDWDAGEASLD